MKLKIIEEFLKCCTKFQIKVPDITIEIEDYEENIPEHLHYKKKIEFNTKEGQKIHLIREIKESKA